MKKKTRIPAARATVILVCLLIFPPLFSGCGPAAPAKAARGYADKSEYYYNKAIKAYRDLIPRYKNPAKLNLELGRLYYSHGEFTKAQGQLKSLGLAEANKLLAISYYKQSAFTDALEIFNADKNPDDETLYYQGLTCEKLNLYDQALACYRKIKSPAFLALAGLRINLVERQSGLALIKDIDPQAAKIIAAAPQPENYPQAGGLILLSDEKIEVTDANREISTLRYLIKILNERGKRDFSEAQLEYDSTYEKVELEYARTIKPDGRVVLVGSRHIRDVSKYLNFPLYSNARVYIISFPEIAEGSVIEYKLKVYRNEMINKKDFVLAYPVQNQEPIIQASFTIDLADSRQLKIKTLNDKYNDFQAQLKPALTKNNGRLIYRWDFKNIPQIIPEPNMPANVEVNPAIIFTSFKSWDEVYNWWWALAKDKIKADKEIKDKTAQLTAKLASDEAKARSIYNFCCQNIRYVAVEYGQAGYEPHQAEEIFKNKYGDCKDQAVLLATMLKEAGLNAYLVLIPTRSDYNLNPDFPSVIFDHCIAAVKLQDKLIFLDPTAQTCSFGDLPQDDQNRRVLVFKEDGYEIINTPLYPSRHNLLRQELKINLDKDEGITADKKIFSYGIYDQAQRYWLLYTPPELIAEAIKEKIGEVSIGATLDKYEIKNLNDLDQPLVLAYKFKGKEYATSAGDLMIIPQLSSLDTSLAAKDKRRFPIDFYTLESKETVFSINIPAGFKVKYLPANVSEDSPWLKFNVEYKLRDNRIFYSQDTELKRSEVKQEEYSDFKNFFEHLAKKIKQRIILEREK